jgi:hypothetical protein
MAIRNILVLFVSLIVHLVSAQSTAYVLQGGLTIGSQRWDNSFDRELLFAPHGAISIETLNNENDNASLYMQIGFHIKGSATRFRFVNVISGAPGRQFTEEFRFNNISATFGAKAKRDWNKAKGSKYYYFGGVRGDYTYSTNIDELAANNPFNRNFYPNIFYMNRWMAGVSAGAGIEMKFSELIGGEVKLSVCPDFTLQYSQPSIPNVIDPLNQTGTITIPDRRIRNISIELTFGLRLLRKVVYVED